jgi:hypothetical protein
MARPLRRHGERQVHVLPADQIDCTHTLARDLTTVHAISQSGREDSFVNNEI